VLQPIARRKGTFGRHEEAAAAAASGSKPGSVPQRRTTVMVKVSRRFVDETLWPEFEQLSAVLRTHINDLTERIISTAIHQDVSDAAEAEVSGALGAPADRDL
jgi:hypothetical protein